MILKKETERMNELSNFSSACFHYYKTNTEKLFPFFPEFHSEMREMNTAFTHSWTPTLCFEKAEPDRAALLPRRTALVCDSA